MFVRKFLKDDPEIFSMIHPTLNEGIDFEKLTTGMRLKLWWRCKVAECDHHVWQTRIDQILCSRNTNTKTKGCPFCHHKKICKCVSFGTLYPELLKEFDDKNLDPFAISSNINKIISWKCIKHTTCDQHKWKTTPNARIYKNHGCPYCNHKKICKCDSLGTLYPEIAKELDPNIDPYSIAPQSGKILTWYCRKAECGCPHIWKTVCSNRTTREKTGCPYCSGRRVCKCNSLGILYPNIAKELDEKVDTFSIPPQSGKKFTWTCLTCKFKWTATVKSRTIGMMCPECKLPSRMEYVCRKVLKDLGEIYLMDHRLPGCKDRISLRFDFYLPYSFVIIELDGPQHFKAVEHFGAKLGFEETQKKDVIKNKYCMDNDINMLRIAYSERKNVEKHVKEFLEFIKENDTVHMFIGKEYCK